MSTNFNQFWSIILQPATLFQGFCPVFTCQDTLQKPTDGKFKGKENMFLIGMKSTSQFIKMLKGQLNCSRR